MEQQDSIGIKTLCGIFGWYAFKNALPVDTANAILEKMAEITRHRGPDDWGSTLQGQAALGMTRLSIIDVTGGHQPLSSMDDKTHLVCNGEIYNFKGLRETLISHGAQFKTGSDSEVVLHAFREYGFEALQKIEGMFNFAAYDAPENQLLIARDRLGIKPLYYWLSDDFLVFATEIKALLQHPDVKKTLNTEALDQYLQLGYVPQPATLFKGIYKLAPGHAITLDRGFLKIKQYWRPEPKLNPIYNQADWISQTRQAVETAVSKQMVADVPIGAFLSGGIDSSLVVAEMAKHSAKAVKTYSIGFEGDAIAGVYDERVYARQVAKLFNTDHREIVVKPDVATLLPKLLWHMDEPISDSAIVTTYLVSEFAARDVKVILSGVGGDELFGGYRRYLGEHYASIYQKIPPFLRQRVLKPILDRLPADRHHKILNLFRYAKSFADSAELSMPARYSRYVSLLSPELKADLLKQAPTASMLDSHIETVFADLLQSGAMRQGDTLTQLMCVDMVTQLPDDLLLLTDKMSMATSLECRVPLLDEALVDLSLRMPEAFKIKGQSMKHILKVAFEDTLPKEILYRSKRGFGAPMGGWLKDALKPVFHDLLSKDAIEARGFFDANVVHQCYQDHISSKADYTDLLLALVNFEIWYQLYFEDETPESITDRLQGTITREHSVSMSSVSVSTETRRENTTV